MAKEQIKFIQFYNLTVATVNIEFFFHCNNSENTFLYFVVFNEDCIVLCDIKHLIIII